jgi:cytochrome P450 family 6
MSKIDFRFETSSSTMTCAIYEMVKQPLIQNRLREDIRKALKTTKGAVTYELVMHELPYLNQIISEALRMYPVLALFDRMCEMTNGSDGYSLEPYGDFKIPNGTPVMFPAYAMSYDEKFFAREQRQHHWRIELSVRLGTTCLHWREICNDAG